MTSHPPDAASGVPSKAPSCHSWCSSPTHDAEAWARDYVAALNKKKETASIESTITFNPDRAIDTDKQRSYNGGYLFLQQIYHELGLDKIAKAIKKKHSFE